MLNRKAHVLLTYPYLMFFKLMYLVLVVCILGWCYWL